MNGKTLKKILLSLLIITIVLIQVKVFLPIAPLQAAGTNLALGKTITANNYTQVYIATNANDGNVTTYWEGAANAYPNILTVDLGSTQTINNIVLKLNPDAIWGTRTQTFSVLGSTDNSTYNTIVSSVTYTFDPATGNTVSISFTNTNQRYVRLNFTANSGTTGGQVAEFEVYNTDTPTPTPTPTPSPGTTNVAVNKVIAASSYTQVYVATNANDGSVTSYWEGAPNSYPNLLTVDLGALYTASSIIIKLNPNSVWSARTQTLSVLGSTDNVTYNTLKGSATYTFDPATGNVVTLTFANTDVRYVRLNITANSGATGGQVAEVEVYASQEATPTPTPTPTFEPGTKYEAENAALSGTAKVNTDHTGYSGIGFVDGYWNAGPATAFTVSADITGWYDVTLRYANAMGNTRTLSVYVNGVDKLQSTFPNLADWNIWADKTETIYLSGGTNTVAYKFDSDDTGNINLDYITISPSTVQKPDLTITGITWSPASPVETDAITLTATVKNAGTGSATASNVKFYLGTTLVGTVATPVIAAGATSNVSVNIGAQNAATYSVTAKADEANILVELDDGNNNFTSASFLVVNPVSSSDLVGNVSWTPSNPSGGNTVAFTVTLKNQGIITSAAGTHAITLVLKNSSGATVQTFNGSYSGYLAVGTAVNVIMGTWTAVDGSYTLTNTIAVDANEVAIKQANNVSTVGFFAGRGANMPYTKIEAESPAVSTNGTVLAPNYKLADYAGEASGRSAVYLDTTGEYVEFTMTAPTNAFVLRNAIPNSADGAGIDSSVSVYVDGVNKGKLNVSSKFSYVYASPTTLGQLGYNNSPGGTAYWLYEDANMMLDQVYPAGTKIRIQKDASDVSWIYVDFIETENVASAASNPDPTKYVQVSSTKSIDTALQEFRSDITKLGIFIPAGTWSISNKIFLYGRAVQIIGAGPWWTKLTAPVDQSNTDVGFNISSAANGSTLKDFSIWGNYKYRVDGPGKAIDGNGMQNVTINNLWIEHFICMYWGVGSSYNTFKNCRIRNTFADGINMTNGSSYNTITNCDARATGDDSFALFSAADAGGSYNVGNKYTNLTATCPRRAACFAVYGGSDNLYQNLYGADTLTYPGITINSYSFGYNTLGFGDVDCVFDGITLDRTGGDFWTSNGADDKINDYQNFGAIWFYAGDRGFKNILVKNVDINNPVYFGLMFQCMYPNPQTMSNIRCENININNAPRYGIKLVVRSEAGQGPPVGGGTFTNVKVNNPGIAAIYGQSGSPAFTVTKVGTDNNW